MSDNKGYRSVDRRRSILLPMATMEEQEMLEDQHLRQLALRKQLDEQRATEDYIDANFLASVGIAGGARV